MTPGGFVTSLLILLTLVLLLEGPSEAADLVASVRRGLGFLRTPPAVTLGALCGLLWLLRRAGRAR